MMKAHNCKKSARSLTLRWLRWNRSITIWCWRWKYFQKSKKH